MKSDEPDGSSFFLSLVTRHSSLLSEKKKND